MKSTLPYEEWKDQANNLWTQEVFPVLLARNTAPIHVTPWPWFWEHGFTPRAACLHLLGFNPKIHHEFKTKWTKRVVFDFLYGLGF